MVTRDSQSEYNSQLEQTDQIELMQAENDVLEDPVLQTDSIDFDEIDDYTEIMNPKNYDNYSDYVISAVLPTNNDDDLDKLNEENQRFYDEVYASLTDEEEENEQSQLLEARNIQGTSDEGGIMKLQNDDSIETDLDDDVTELYSDDFKIDGKAAVGTGVDSFVQIMQFKKDPTMRNIGKLANIVSELTAVTIPPPVGLVTSGMFGTIGGMISVFSGTDSKEDQLVKALKKGQNKIL